MTYISPSLLSCDFLNVENELNVLNRLKNIWLHLDIMDGHFVPNLTFGSPLVSQLHKKTSHPLDAHFMVTNPEFYIESFKNYGLHNFTFHIEATDQPVELLQKAKSYYPSVGISLRPHTPIERLNEKILDSLDLILVMSVEPGFGGQKFIDGSLERIAKIKKMIQKRSITIQVDGGINHQNAKDIIKAGADNLVAGSYIFKAGQDNYSTQVESLRN